MPYILPRILSLIQYKNDIEDNIDESMRLERCECCGKLGPQRYGYYLRKSGRISGVDVSLNPIKIQRYYCPSCCRTMSVLPECIPPRRWYLWEVQQAVLLLLLSGLSICAVAKTSQPSRHTVARWLARLKAQFLAQRDTLVRFKEDLCKSVTFTAFWQTCLGLMTLGEAMRICHVTGVYVP